MVNKITTEENTTRLIEASDNLRKVFASTDGFTCDAGLSEHEFLALESVSDQKELTMSKLAKNLNIGLSTATGIIDRLIKRKLVIRERNPDDRRIVKVLLSKKGYKIMSSHKEQERKSLKKMMGFLTESEQKNFILIMEKMANKMQKK